LAKSTTIRFNFLKLLDRKYCCIFSRGGPW